MEERTMKRREQVGIVSLLIACVLILTIPCPGDAEAETPQEDTTVPCVCTYSPPPMDGVHGYGSLDCVCPTEEQTVQIHCAGRQCSVTTTPTTPDEHATPTTPTTETEHVATVANCACQPHPDEEGGVMYYQCVCESAVTGEAVEAVCTTDLVTSSSGQVYVMIKCTELQNPPYSQ